MTPPPLANYLLRTVAVGILAVAAAAWLLYATPHGLGIASDSVIYLGGATHLAAGDGFTRIQGNGDLEPITHFPPLYSAVLALPALIGTEPGTAVRFLHSFFLALLVLAVLIAIRAAGAGESAALATAALAAVSPIFLENAAWALSEMVFLLLLLAGILALERGVRRGQPGSFVFAGLLMGLAYLTRYVGTALVAAGLARILFASTLDRRARTSAIVAFLGASLLPVVAWLARNWILTGTFTNRTLTWHPLTITKWKSPFQLLWTWLLPFKFNLLALEITIVVLVGGVLLIAWRAVRDRPPVMARAIRFLREGGLASSLVLVAAAYTFTVWTSLLLLDASTPVDLRISAPVYLCALLLAGVGAERIARSSRAGRWFVLVVGFLVCTGYVVRSLDLVSQYRRDGQGYASEAWLQSGMVAAVRRLPTSARLYTNNPEVVSYFTGRGAFGLPQAFDSVTGRVVTDFTNRLEAVRADLADGEGAVIVFASPGWEPEFEALAPLLASLQPYYEGPDGVVRVANMPAGLLSIVTLTPVTLSLD